MWVSIRQQQLQQILFIQHLTKQIVLNSEFFCVFNSFLSFVFSIFFNQYGRRSQHCAIHLLLIISFLFVIIALPFTQAFLYTSYVYPANQLFCSLWTWIHYSLNIINRFLMPFASIERHWLIFHPWLVRSKADKVIFHYCPLLFCLLYPPMLYMGVIFIYQCEPYDDYTQLLCTILVIFIIHNCQILIYFSIIIYPCLLFLSFISSSMYASIHSKTINETASIQMEMWQENDFTIMGYIKFVFRHVDAGRIVRIN
jgi:hypothetical protein